MAWDSTPAFESLLLERRFGRPRDHLSSRLESGAVAWTIPRPLRLVPVDDASHVRARGGHSCDGAARVAVHRQLLAVQMENLPRAAAHRTQRSPFGAGESIADEVIRIVLVLADVIPERAENLRAARLEQIGPRIAASEHAVGGHHPRQRAERHAVAGISGAGELMVRRLADVRQAVGRFNHLSRPAMRDADAADHHFERAFEPFEAAVGVARLPGLVVLSAEDDDVLASARLEPN